MNFNDIKMLESVSTRAWPALETMNLDGWLLRFARGVTKRANAVHPFDHSSMDIEKKLKICETSYRELDLPVIFKMTPSSRPEGLDAVLEKRGYARIDPTSVQTAAITDWPPETGCSMSIDLSVTEDWLMDFQTLSGRKDGDMIELRLLFPRIDAGAFLRLIHGNRTVGCGLAVHEKDHLGFFDIIVGHDQRNRGFGMQIIQALATWGRRRGASIGYLQVEADNTPAMNLYQKLGFREQYQYAYRAKDAA